MSIEAESGFGELVRPDLVLRVLAGAGALAVGTLEGARLAHLQYRSTHTPTGGREESSLPYYRALVEAVEAEELEVAMVGGVPKQALTDPRTEFDLKARQIIVPEDPDCHTRTRATLYRPTGTLRDMDLRLKSHPSMTGERIPTTADCSATLSNYRALLQAILNETAHKRSFPRGPELSLFSYDAPYGHRFRPTDYATRTELGDREGHPVERLFDNNGNSVELPVTEGWTCMVSCEDEQVAIPTDSPVDMIGRSLTRSIVLRERDGRDVTRAVKNIQAKGLGNELLGDRWQTYTDFRHMLDESISPRQAAAALRAGQVGLGLSRLAARAAASTASIVETRYGNMIQDPELPLAATLASVMGARR